MKDEISSDALYAETITWILNVTSFKIFEWFDSSSVFVYSFEFVMKSFMIISVIDFIESVDALTLFICFEANCEFFFINASNMRYSLVVNEQFRSNRLWYCRSLSCRSFRFENRSRYTSLSRLRKRFWLYATCFRFSSAWCNLLASRAQIRRDLINGWMIIFVSIKRFPIYFTFESFLSFFSRVFREYNAHILLSTLLKSSSFMQCAF